MWIKWAFFEGLAKTAHKILQKLVGKGSGLAGAFLVTWVIGVMQMLVGFFGARARKEKILAPKLKIFGSIIFGISASVMTVLGVYTFTFSGADVGVSTFFIMLSIVPSVLADKFIFREKISPRKLAGVFLYLLTGFFFLIGLEKSDMIFSLPVWVWPSVGIAFLLTFNEIVTRKISDKMKPLANNFWIGLTTLIFSGIGFIIFGGLPDLKMMAGAFWFITAVMGLITTAMIVFKLMAYRAGGNLVIKQLVMQGTYLIGANFLGWLFFAETWTIGKSLGIPLFLIAYLVAHERKLKVDLNA